jgi:hypothetical protein
MSCGVLWFAGCRSAFGIFMQPLLPAFLIAPPDHCLRSFVLCHVNRVARTARDLRKISTAVSCSLRKMIYTRHSLDRHPGMIRFKSEGAAFAAELYAVPRASFPQVVEEEAPGLSVGRVLLDDGTSPLGVITGGPR